MAPRGVATAPLRFRAMKTASEPPLPSGLVAFVKRECATCQTVAPVLRQLAEASALTIYTQDDKSFPEGLEPQDDTSLRVSWHHDVEVVPTLIRVEDGAEQARVIGWHRGEWEEKVELP